MRRQKDRDLRRRRQRRSKLRKLKIQLRQSKDSHERERLLDKIRRIMVSPTVGELERLDKEFRPS